MRKIKKTDIKRELIDLKLLREVPVLYTELPHDAELLKIVNTMANYRKNLNKDSYIIVPKDTAYYFRGYDRAIDIECKLHTTEVPMVLLQYGLTYKLRTNLELQQVLSRLYTTVLDPCAGTGESTDLFDNAYLFDKDQKCINNLKAKYKTRIKDKEDDN